jgi:hypothetical protein
MRPRSWEFYLTFVGVYQNVKEVDNIAGIVERPPESRHGVVELPEYCTTNHEHEVVEYGYRDQHKPLKMVKRSIAISMS